MGVARKLLVLLNDTLVSTVSVRYMTCRCEFKDLVFVLINTHYAISIVPVYMGHLSVDSIFPIGGGGL